jgi:hypothetical protein
MLVTFPVKKKKESFTKKIKRENISNILKLEKEMKTYKKSLSCNIKVQI